MDKQQISHLLHIQKASRENRLAIFVGAGVSRNSGIPTWNELIESMKAELPEKLTNEMDALKVAQLYKDSRGHKEYMDKVKEVLLYNKAVPNRLHKSILLLNPCHIITTNYDDLIEQELINQFTQYDIVREDKDIPQIAYPNVLVKMHGDYITDNIVLTETDYYNYPKNFPLIRAFVQSIFASKLVLFVGFSFADLNLKMILNELQNILSENMQRAYLLSCEEPDFVTKQYFEKKGINILYFSEKEIDVINGKEYNPDDLNGIGRLTDKILYAINNYSKIPKQDLSAYLYDRVMSYSQELRSFGDGLRYFFPQDRSEKMFWNTHSCGLQTGLSDFKELAKQVKTNQGKRQYLISHPKIQLKPLLKFACYNYLYEIDGIKIIDSKFIKNANHYFPKITLYYLHHFSSTDACKSLKLLREKDIQYTLNDLELPFTLYQLGDYWEAYRMYRELLPQYWQRKKYILYFICRYNMWSIKGHVAFQKIWDETIDINKELKLAEESDLDDILRKLPLDIEIKNIFQDLISYRDFGKHNVRTEQLKEEILKQRKSAERGGWSINNNITVLMSLYQRESVFSWANYIICDNNGYYKSICNNTASGILNSFLTPQTEFLGKKIKSTKINELNDFMLEMLVFDMDNKKLQNLFKNYEIFNLKISESGLTYINSCLKGLTDNGQFLYKDESRFYIPLSNLMLIISKSQKLNVDINLLYQAVIKYWKYEQQISSNSIECIVNQFTPCKEEALKLLESILYHSANINEYFRSIYILVEYLKKQGQIFTDIRMNELINNQDKIKALSLIYPIVQEKEKINVLDCCLKMINSFYDYIYFIYSNNIIEYSIEKFKELLEIEKKSINESHCYLLSKIRKDNNFQDLNVIIDDFAQNNDCMQFFLSPDNYSSPEKVEIDWILKLENRADFFKNEIYRNKLKEYIKVNTLNKESLNYLIGLL